MRNNFERLNLCLVLNRNEKENTSTNLLFKAGFQCVFQGAKHKIPHLYQNPVLTSTVIQFIVKWIIRLKNWVSENKV